VAAAAHNASLGAVAAAAAVGRTATNTAQSVGNYRSGTDITVARDMGDAHSTRLGLFTTCVVKVKDTAHNFFNADNAVIGARVYAQANKLKVRRDEADQFVRDYVTPTAARELFVELCRQQGVPYLIVSAATIVDLRSLTKEELRQKIVLLTRKTPSLNKTDEEIIGDVSRVLDDFPYAVGGFRA
jgi:hypothetical protein